MSTVLCVVTKTRPIHLLSRKSGESIISFNLGGGKNELDQQLYESC